MRRDFAGFRAARIRPDGAVRVLVVGGLAVLLAACGPAEADIAAPVAATAAVTTAVPTTAAPAATTTAAPTSAAPVPTPAPEPVAVPDVRGLPAAQARTLLAGLGLRSRLVYARTARYAAGTVVTQSHGTDRRLNPGSVVTLTIAQPPPVVVTPKPTPRPVPTPPPAPAPDPQPACHPSYAGACLDPDASDYDCVGGSGNGPKYTGRVRVVGPDVFGLDADHDGIGCERD